MVYIASMAFFHADPKRSWLHERPKDSGLSRTLVVFGWLLIIGSLGFLCKAWGWERGLAAWFLLLFIAPASSLLLSAFNRAACLPAGTLIAATGALGLVIS